uniref:hypothetical protein n=1 Tax=Candidatus Cryptobacteroides bacterium TaxID=3085639 RepID=UPI004026AC7C
MLEIREEFSGPGRCWNRRFVVWLKGAETGTAYGRQTLDFLVRQYEALRGWRCCARSGHCPGRSGSRSPLRT